MKKLCLIIYTLSLLFTGCTHICKYSTLGELNNKIKDKEAKITLINELDLIGKDINIYTDSTFWLDPNTENKQSIITSEVSSIITKSRWQGVLEGLGLGLLGGAAIGAIIGFESYEGPDLLVGSPAGAALFVGFFCGILGGLLGIPIGAIVGSKDEFIINRKDETTFPQGEEIKEEKTIPFQREEFVKNLIFYFSLSNPIKPNSSIKLEISPHDDVLSIQNILERELSLKGYNVVSEGYVDYTLYFSYNVNEQQKLIGFKAHIINSSTGEIECYSKFNETTEEITPNDLIKEFVNQLFPEMK